jgi:hypothetical protein
MTCKCTALREALARCVAEGYPLHNFTTCERGGSVNADRGCPGCEVTALSLSECVPVPPVPAGKCPHCMGDGWFEGAFGCFDCKACGGSGAAGGGG